MTELLVNIDVDDLAAAERFYCAALALQPGRRFGNGAVEVLGGSSKIYLLAKEDGSSAIRSLDTHRSYKPHWTPIHIDFVVDDIQSAIERSLAAGAVQDGPVRKHVWGQISLMADPFGHGYCLIEFSAAGYDAIADDPRSA